MPMGFLQAAASVLRVMCPSGAQPFDASAPPTSLGMVAAMAEAPGSLLASKQWTGLIRSLDAALQEAVDCDRQRLLLNRGFCLQQLGLYRKALKVGNCRPGMCGSSGLPHGEQRPQPWYKSPRSARRAEQAACGRRRCRRCRLPPASFPRFKPSRWLAAPRLALTLPVPVPAPTGL